MVSEGSQQPSAVRIPNWSEIQDPPAEGTRYYGPNWSTDPESLQPRATEGETGALVWPLRCEDDEQTPYVFPELRSDLPVGHWLRERHNLGIALSGGGQRAAVCALGWLRALQHLQLLTKARYLSANSGGTWTSLPLVCDQLLKKKNDGIDIDYAEYLGAYVPPENITLSQSELGKIGKILEEADIGDFKSLDFESQLTPWTQLIERAYFTPLLESKADHWLEVQQAYLWNNSKRNNNEVLNQYHSLPFPIFAATASEKGKPNAAYPVELTGLYGGIPIHPKSVQTRATVGGGFVQGCGLNSAKLKDPRPVAFDKEGEQIKSFENPSPVVKLFQLTAASSNYGGAMNANTKLDLGVFTRFSEEPNTALPINMSFWSPTTGGDPVDLELFDGGVYDNLGVLMLLRRGCSSIIVCSAASVDVLECKEEDWLSAYADLGSLFGLKAQKSLLNQVWSSWTKREFDIASRSHVFDSDEFDRLMNDMVALAKQGKPLVVRRPAFRVRRNVQSGIYQEQEVDITFCINSKVGDWTKKASEAVQKVSDVKDSFPNFSTFESSFSANEVNMLAHLCSYNLIEGLKSVQFDVTTVPK